jgi:hypothetical protein
MSRNWVVGEPQNVYDYLQEDEDEINVGDTIEYISNNQMGYVKYLVILDDDGKKNLKKLTDYDSMDTEHEEKPDYMSEEPKKGGKKRRTMKMRKTRRNKKMKRSRSRTKKIRKHKKKY